MGAAGSFRWIYIFSCQNAFGLMCVGIVCLPIALYLLGSNEQNYMCSHKNIIFADNKAKARAARRRFQV